MEVWDVYDIRRNKTDRVMIRGEEVSEGDYHLVVHVCIFNKEGKMLIQHRHENKRDGRTIGPSRRGRNSRRNQPGGG